jgi:hypothetical protein
MSEQPQKQINFSIVPDEEHADAGRVYANFCAIAHTPFDFTLTFCEVTPLSPHDIEQAEAQGVVRAPVKVRLVAPVPFIPQLIAALQEHLRVYSESYGGGAQPVPQGPVH